MSKSSLATSLATTRECGPSIGEAHVVEMDRISEKHPMLIDIGAGRGIIFCDTA